MLRILFRLSLLVIVSVGAVSLTQAQVRDSPVVLVDSTLEQCSNDPSLIAYPCARTIQEAVDYAVGRAFDATFILVIPSGDKPYEGFSVDFGKLRSLLIQGFRGTPLIQGRISLDGSGDWIVVLKNLELQGPGPLITMGLRGSPFFTRLEGIVANAQGAAVSVRDAVVLETRTHG